MGVYWLLGGLSWGRRFLPGLWDFLKLELYYIDGACQNTGMCCKGLSLVVNGLRLNTLAEFDQALTQYPVYRRFIPHLDDGGEIRHFGCQCLTSDNYCSDYEGRPKLCRQYPMSAFLQHDQIISGCGYRVRRRYFKYPLWISKTIRSKMVIMDALNQIS